MKTFIPIAIIALVGIGGLYAYSKYQPHPDSSSVQQPSNEVGPASSTPKQNLTNADFSWRIEKASDYEETFPHQIVYLDVKGHSYKAGESWGCDVNNQEVSETNEITRQTCWFGGGGDVFGVFLENGSYVLKHRWIQESGGPEVNADPQGPWETVLKISKGF